MSNPSRVTLDLIDSGTPRRTMVLRPPGPAHIRLTHVAHSAGPPPTQPTTPIQTNANREKFRTGLTNGFPYQAEVGVGDARGRCCVSVVRSRRDFRGDQGAPARPAIATLSVAVGTSAIVPAPARRGAAVTATSLWRISGLCRSGPRDLSPCESGGHARSRRERSRVHAAERKRVFRTDGHDDARADGVAGLAGGEYRGRARAPRAVLCRHRVTQRADRSQAVGDVRTGRSGTVL